MKSSPSIRRTASAILLLLVCATAPLHAQQDVATDPPLPPSRGGRVSTAAPATQAAEGPTAPFAATIYELHMPADQIGRLDIDALTKAAATRAGFDKALAALGTAHISYLVNQSVQLAQDSIRIGASMPYVTNAQVTNRGDTVNSVAYTNIGAIFSISGKLRGLAQADLNLHVMVAGITDAGVAISENVTAPCFRTAQMARKGPVQLGQPFVLVSADGASTDADGNAIVVVARVTVGPVE